MTGPSPFAKRLEAFRGSPEGRPFERPSYRSFAEMTAYFAECFDMAAEAAQGSGLRPHQIEVMKATADHFAKGGEQSICVAPTGSGKTEIFQTLIASTCQRRPRSGRMIVPNTVILVPTQQLVQQTVARFETFLPHLPVGYLSRLHGASFGPICVGTYEGFTQSVLEGSIEPEDIDHLVLDEAHRVLSELRRDVFGRFVGRVLVDAYTASPVFGLTKHLYSLLGIENVVANISLRRMIDEKVLAPVVNYVLRVRLNGEMPGDGVDRRALLSRVAADTACSFFLGDRPDMPGGPLLARSFLGYVRGIAEAHAAAEIFSDRSGRRVLGLSGRDTGNVQSEALAQLAGGEVAGIFNARLLIEGTDVPRVNLVMNLSQTNSLVNQLQRCGRGLRIDPLLDVDDPSQTAAVIDVCFEINGKPHGRPKFFFEAVDDIGIARLVAAPVRMIEDVMADLIEIERTGSLPEEDGDAPEMAFVVAEDIDIETGVPIGELLLGTGAMVDSGRGFEIDTDIRSVQFFLRNLEASRDGSWLGLVEVMRRLRTSRENIEFEDLWSKMTDLANAGLPVVVDGRQVWFMVTDKRPGQGFAFLHEGDLEWVGERVGRPLDMPEATDAWVGISRACSLLELSYKTVRSGWTMLAEKAAGSGEAVLPEGRVRFELRRGRSGPAHHAHVDDLDVIGRHLRPIGTEAAKTSDWLTPAEAGRAIGFLGNTPRLDAIWKDLIAAAEAGSPYGDRNIRFERRWNYNQVNWYIHVDEVPWLASVTGADRRPDPKTEEWLGRQEVSGIVGIRKESKAFGAVWNRLVGQFDGTGSVVVDGRPLKAERRSVLGIHPLCVHESEALRLPGIFGVHDERTPAPEVGDEWLQPARAAELAGVPPGNNGFKSLIARFQRTAGRSVEEFEHRGIRFAIRRAATTKLCLHRDSPRHIAEALGTPWPPVRPKEAGWIGKTEVCSRLGFSQNTPSFDDFWAGIPVGTEDGPTPVLVPMRTNSGTHPCLHERHLAALEKQVAPLFEVAALDGDWYTLDRADREKDSFPGAYTLLQSAFKELGRQLDDSRATQIEGRPIRAEYRRIRVGKIVVCVHSTSFATLMEAVRSRAPKHPPKTDHWVGIREAGRLLGIGLPAQLKQLWARFSETGAEEGTIAFGTVTVRYGIRTSVGSAVMCLRKEDLKAFGSLIDDPKKIPAKGDDWLSPTQVAIRLGRGGIMLTTGTEIHTMFADLKRQFDDGGQAVLADGTPIRMAVRRTGPKTTGACIHIDDIEKIRKILTPTDAEKLKPKDETALTYREVCRAVRRGTSDPMMIEVWGDLETAFERSTPLRFNGKSIMPVEVRSGTHRTICLRKADVAAFASIYDDYVASYGAKV